MKVTYTKPTTDSNNRLEDAAGNEVDTFTDRPVTNNTVVTNSPATGTPAITAPNVFRVPAVLGVDLSGIADPNGVRGIASSATYQWQRFAANGTTLEVANLGTGSTLTLAASHRGKRLKVLVRFTDDAGNSEGPLTSDATPVITAAVDLRSGVTIRAGDAVDFAIPASHPDRCPGEGDLLSYLYTNRPDPDRTYDRSVVEVDGVRKLQTTMTQYGLTLIGRNGETITITGTLAPKGSSPFFHVRTISTSDQCSRQGDWYIYTRSAAGSPPDSSPRPTPVPDRDRGGSGCMHVHYHSSANTWNGGGGCMSREWLRENPHPTRGETRTEADSHTHHKYDFDQKKWVPDPSDNGGVSHSH